MRGEQVHDDAEDADHRGGLDPAHLTVVLHGLPEHQHRGRIVNMSTFDSTKTQLGSLLTSVVEGKLQLPDFQRGWVWDDEHIRALLCAHFSTDPEVR